MPIDIDRYLRCHGNILPCRMEHVGVVGKTDLWRLLKIYHEGGV